MQSQCANCRTKKPKFLKNQEAKVLLSSLANKTPLSKIPFLNSIL